MDIRNKSECKYDVVSLGEIMLRLDPGNTRIKTTRSFTAWEGGGEYNVTRGLRKCFNMDTAVVTSFVKNDLGYLLEDLVLQGGVDTSLIKWLPFDGIGRKARNGLNFTERGFGLRGALGVSDRAYTAASQLKAGDIDWDYIFGTLGVRWFHTGGIFAALSETTAELIIEAVKTAKKYGTISSYDLNYRPSLWGDIGGKEKAQALNKEIAKYIDVMLGNEEDFIACLGFKLDAEDNNFQSLDVSSYEKMMTRVAKEYPNFKVIANTLRAVKSATINDWSAICYKDGKVYCAEEYKDLEIFDRVGGGDSFASGFIYGLMTTGDPQLAVNYGVAHGALAMTTPGDTSMASCKEVEALMEGKGARVQR